MGKDGFWEGVKVSVGRLPLLLFPFSSHPPAFSASFLSISISISFSFSFSFELCLQWELPNSQIWESTVRSLIASRSISCPLPAIAATR